MLLLIVIGLTITHDLLFFKRIIVLVKRQVNWIIPFSSSFILFHFVIRYTLNIVLLVRHIHLLIAAVISIFKVITAAI